MSQIWELLGIESTGDKRAVRRAFAEQAKLHHPEEEPEYFARLNQAYREALRQTEEQVFSRMQRERSGEDRDNREENMWDAGQAAGDQEDRQLQRNMESRMNELKQTNTHDQEAAKRQTSAKDVKDEADQKDSEAGDRKEETGKGTEETLDTAQGQNEESIPSLLELLQAAEEHTIQESMEKGALHDLIQLFENPKQMKQADTWKRFFLSESFLGEQFSQEFTRGLLAYLTRQTVCPADNLPMGFLQELAIAYAFIPHFAGEEYFDGKIYPKEWYKVSVEDTFPARKYAAEIFNMQGRDCDLKSMTGRMLRQPANRVRHHAFSDYMTMKEMSGKGQLTEQERDKWQHILGLCQVNYLYERNGKSLGTKDYESRSECVVKLYVQWMKDERLPEQVLKFFYQKLSLKELERSSTRGLYRELKEQILGQFPQVEEVLFGEDGKEQQITKLYRVYSKIVNDNQNNYERSIYEDTQEIQDRVQEFFALPEWEKLKEDRGLLNRLCDASRRLVMPQCLARRMIAHLSKSSFPEPGRTEVMEYLLRSLSTYRLCRELDDCCENVDAEIEAMDAEPEKIFGSLDFWQYFLMRGFGWRHGRIRGSWEEGMLYELDGECYLPAYIRYLYAPSKIWQQRFVGFDEAQESIASPVSAACRLPDGRKLRVEFHYHYCLYFVDEVQVNGPVLSLEELQKYAKGLENAEEFFFLLGVTAIEDLERSSAEELILEWLEKIPIDSWICPVVARLLAADNDRVNLKPEGQAEDLGRAEDSGQEEVSVRKAVPWQTEGFGGSAGSGEADTVCYGEGERFCFRAMVSAREIRVYRLAEFGWEDRIFRKREFGWKRFPCIQEKAQGFLLSTREGRQAAAHAVLKDLRQPRPVRRAVYDVEGMDAEKKAAVILEAMEYPGRPEGYCVLRYGQKKERRYDRVFYGALEPFGFDIKAQSPDHARTMDYLRSASRTKIKERCMPAGRFGWGFKYSHKSDYGPMCVYLGESGTYYAYGALKMHRADSLAKLLAEYFSGELEGVTEVETYEGCLTVSRLDHRLEYCYSPKDALESLYSPKDTQADQFTIFGRSGQWMEFAAWLDEILKQGLPSWVQCVAIGLDWEQGGIPVFTGFRDAEEEAEEESEGEFPEEKELYRPQGPLLFWEKALDAGDRERSLYEAVQWYMSCGAYREVLGDERIQVLM